MIIRNLDQIRKSDRNVRSNGWASARMLLKDDGMGFSFHVTTMFAGSELKMHYQNHLEAVFVLKGTGTIEDLDSGEIHRPPHRAPRNRHTDRLRLQSAGHRQGSA